MGLHYICYRLAQQGWHVNTGQRGAMSPTKGECWRDKNKPITFQTRSQTDKRPIPLGTGAITKDLLVAVIGLGLNKPEVYIFTADEAIDETVNNEGYLQQWIPVRTYDTDQFKERWDKFETYAQM